MSSQSLEIVFIDKTPLKSMFYRILIRGLGSNLARLIKN